MVCIQQWQSLGKSVQLGNGKRVEYHYAHGERGIRVRATLIGKEFGNHGEDYIVRIEYLGNVMTEDITIFARLNKKLGLYDNAIK